MDDEQSLARLIDELEKLRDLLDAQIALGEPLPAYLSSLLDDLDLALEEILIGRRQN